MNTEKENLVIIFAKKPEIGKTKTRIAVETSTSFAYDFSLACFLDLLNGIKGSIFYDLVMVVDSPQEAAWFEKNYNVESVFINLSEEEKRERGYTSRFNYIFSKMTKYFDYQKVILIPMDVPFLKEEELVSAFIYLDKFKYVVGPETNGGVYLIGVKAPFKKGIFDNVPWSTPYSCEKLISNMKKEGNSVYELKYKEDFNTFQAVLRFKKEIETQCPELYRLLKSNGYYLQEESRFVDYDSLKIRIPIAACIVEKLERGVKSVLIQTRFKPSVDPEHTGLIEIPGGLLDKSLSVEEVALREVREETGVICKLKNYKKPNRSPGDEFSTLINQPFCCVQQIIGKRKYVGLIFIAEYISGELKENYRETKNPRWISLKELKTIVLKRPESIFSLYLPVLKKYLKIYE